MSECCHEPVTAVGRRSNEIGPLTTYESQQHFNVMCAQHRSAGLYSCHTVIHIHVLRYMFDSAARYMQL